MVSYDEVFNKGLVSVYIPTHNRSELLIRAVKSVQNQSYSNIEIIICDDGSTDNTEDVVRKICNEDKRITYLKNDKPMGACHARNRCIGIANGEYITGLDDDDLFLPNRIEGLIKAIAIQQCHLLCTDMIFRGDSKDKKWNGKCGAISLDMMGYRNYVGNQIFTKTEVIRNIGGFDVNFPAWQDYDLWYRLIKRMGPCFKIKEATYIVNIESGRQRITTGSKAHRGYLSFIKAHSETLNKKHLRSLYIQDKKNRGDGITFHDVMNNFTIINFLYYIKDRVKNM